MTTENETPAPTNFQQQYEDGISLVDIVNVLLKRKKLILGITAFILCVGLFYAFSQKRVYQVETILLPPTTENIQQLNITDSNVTNKHVTTSGIGVNVTQKSVFSSFISNLNSRKLRQEFFNKYNLLETLLEDANEPLSKKSKNDAFEGFLNSLKVQVNDSTGVARILLEGYDKDKIGIWLDGLVEMTSQKTKDQLVRNLKAALNSNITALKIDISSIRSTSKKRREDEILGLKEAYRIAKSLNITEHVNVPSAENKSKNTVSTKLDIINSRLGISNLKYLPDYMKGTKVLQAELNALKNRKNDDFKIEGLRDLQGKMARFEAVTVKYDKLQTIVVDKKAILDIKPIRPNRKLIIILSFILGGMLSLFVVFILELIGNFKNKFNNESNYKHA